MARRVLVVDDENTLQMALRFAFEGAGWEVVTAGSAEEAQTRLGENAVEAVLIDKNLPAKSGIDLVRWIRERNRTVVLVVMTAYANAQSATEALNIGIDRYLEKPFDNLIAIPKIVESVLQQEGRGGWLPDHAQATLEARGLVSAAREKPLRVVLACGAAADEELGGPLRGFAPAGSTVERLETVEAGSAAFDEPPQVDLVLVDADQFPKLVPLVESVRAKAQFVEITVVVSSPLPLSQLQDLILAGVLQIVDRESGDTKSQLRRVIRGIR